MTGPEFAKVHAVLDGERLELDAPTSKLLRFMLQDPRGCDSSIAPDRWIIQFGWNPSHHRYLLETAPRVMSWLLTQTGGQRVAVIAAGSVAPQPVPDHPEVQFPAWSYGARAIWIAPTPARVTILVREALPGMSLDDLPTPIAPPPELVDAAPPCPFCTVGPPFRRLRDGSLVCQACGRSFDG